MRTLLFGDMGSRRAAAGLSRHVQGAMFWSKLPACFLPRVHSMVTNWGHRPCGMGKEAFRHKCSSVGKFKVVGNLNVRMAAPFSKHVRFG
jgi:hypothetical protein